MQHEDRYRIMIIDKRHDLEVKDQGYMLALCVLQLLADKQRTKRLRNIEIGRKVAHPTGNNEHQFQGQTVKGQGHYMPTNLRPNVHHLPNGKAYELQTWHTHGARKPVSRSPPTSAMTSNVKGQGCKVTS